MCSSSKADLLLIKSVSVRFILFCSTSLSNECMKSAWVTVFAVSSLLVLLRIFDSLFSRLSAFFDKCKPHSACVPLYSLYFDIGLNLEFKKVEILKYTYHIIITAFTGLNGYVVIT